MSNQIFRIREHILPGQHIRQYPHSTANGQEDIIKFAVKQYTPLDNLDPSPGDVTILAAHANGFPKELYEPLWDELLEQARRHRLPIRNIWIADVSFQGQSSVINEGLLGDDPSWYDHPRDMLHMVNHFRTVMPRPIVGIGHSMGGNNLVNVSLMHPRLLETVILIDPVIIRTPSNQGNYGPAQASSKRRDRWPSRTAAAAAFKKSKFYQRWDPRVLDRWIQYGIRELPTALYSDPEATSQSENREVTLTTTKHMEVFTFVRPSWGTVSNRKTHPDNYEKAESSAPFYRPEPITTFHQLPHLRPSVLYIFGAESAISAPQLRADKLAHTGTGIGGNGGVREGNVKEVVLERVGHLIPMEKVGETAQTCMEWLSQRVGEEWHEREEQEASQWSKLSLREKTTMSDEFITKIQDDAWLAKPKI